MTTAPMSLAKGLEFRAVVVMACDEGVLPLDERVADAADEAELDDIYETERRLLYVACTRAREHLLLTGVTPTSPSIWRISPHPPERSVREFTLIGDNEEIAGAAGGIEHTLDHRAEWVDRGPVERHCTPLTSAPSRCSRSLRTSAHPVASRPRAALARRACSARRLADFGDYRQNVAGGAIGFSLDRRDRSPRAAAIVGLPSLTPFAFAAASADLVRPEIKARSFSASAA